MAERYLETHDEEAAGRIAERKGRMTAEARQELENVRTTAA